MDDQAARMEQLYRRIGLDIRAFLRRRIQDTDLADELLQETFLVAWRNPEALDAAVSERAWLMGIARNLFRQHLRRKARNHTVSLPEDIVATAERSEDSRIDAIRAAIARLPTAQREVLELRLRHELRYEEIAAVLGIPIGTVRSRLHHALRRLRSCATHRTCSQPADGNGGKRSET